MASFNKYMLLANLYKTEIELFTDKIQKHNHLVNTELFLEYAYKHTERIIYKVFITELKQNNNFKDTLANMKDLIDSKYSGINQLVNNQLNTLFNSYANVTNDIFKSIHKLYDLPLNHKITIEPVGDFHNNKFVAKISESNLIYYYKPRLADLEGCFIKVLQLLNPQVENVFAPIVEISNRCKIIEEKDYSLHSDLNQFETLTTAPDLNYYILAVLCLLGARDMHYGNFLQLGNILYPVDFETLISPQINEIREYNQYTILCSLILPTISNSGLDFSLFGYDSQKVKDIDFFDIQNIYTDQMDFYINKKRVFTNKISFSFDFAIFKRVYNTTALAFAKNSAKIIDIFTKPEMLIRIIFRSTYLYGKLIESMSHPAICSSIPSIKRYLINQLNNHNISQLPLPQKLLDEEIEQLLHYNIPKIDLSVLSNTLILGNTTVELTGVSACNNILLASNSESVEFNMHLIKLTEYCLYKNQLIHAVHIEYHHKLINQCLPYVQPFYQNGQILGPSYLRKVAKWTVAEVDNSFYGGYFGILLALSSLKGTSKQVTEIVEKISTSNSFLTHGFSGIGGALLAYNELQSKLNLVALDKLASFLRINLKKIVSATEEVEFLNGISGTIYGIWLTDLLNTKEKQDYIKTLITALEQVRQTSGINGWFTKEFPIPQSGLAHGYSGISLAYLAAYLTIGDSNYLTVITQLINLENNLIFNGKWPDLRPGAKTDQEKGLNAWCTGSTGVLLSRLILQKFLKENYLENIPVESIIKEIISTWENKSLALCHGIISDYCVIECIEREVGQQFLRPEDQATLNSRISGFNKDEIAYNPGFMSGLCGLQYYQNSKKYIFMLGI